MASQDTPAPVPFPITRELDLHTFDPRDLPELIPAWLAACKTQGFADARIIHGKGTGALRASVHALLRRHPDVAAFRLGDERSGSWGATVVQLRPATDVSGGARPPGA